MRTTPLKYPALKPPGAKGYFRFHKLGDGYTLEEVKGRILQNVRKQVPFPIPERSPPRQRQMHGRPKQKITGIRALYFRYCYELHILVKHPASVKRVPFSLREDMTKLDRLDRETRFLARTKITTMNELTARKETAESQITAMTTQRQVLRNQVKRQTRRKDFLAADETKAEIEAISAQLKELRKETVLCDGIAARSGQVKENLSVLLHQKEIERKERTTDELHRRRSRTGRADEFGER